MTTDQVLYALLGLIKNYLEDDITKKQLLKEIEFLMNN